MPEIRLRHRCRVTEPDKFEDPQELTRRACNKASRLTQGELETLRAEQAQLAYLFGNLVEQLHVRGVLDVLALAEIFDDLGDYEIATD